MRRVCDITFTTWSVNRRNQVVFSFYLFSFNYFAVHVSYLQKNKTCKNDCLAGTETQFYSLSIPVMLTDCVEACVYLQGDNQTVVDIGLPFSSANYTNWIGTCNHLRYDVTTHNCTLFSD